MGHSAGIDVRLFLILFSNVFKALSGQSRTQPKMYRGEGGGGKPIFQDLYVYNHFCFSEINLYRI